MLIFPLTGLPVVGFDYVAFIASLYSVVEFPPRWAVTVLHRAIAAVRLAVYATTAYALYMLYVRGRRGVIGRRACVDTRSGVWHGLQR